MSFCSARKGRAERRKVGKQRRCFSVRGITPAEGSVRGIYRYTRTHTHACALRKYSGWSKPTFPAFLGKGRSNPSRGSAGRKSEATPALVLPVGQRGTRSGRASWTRGRNSSRHVFLSRRRHDTAALT